jgi:predicted alpha/beta superfamily hydrolase
MIPLQTRIIAGKTGKREGENNLLPAFPPSRQKIILSRLLTCLFFTAFTINSYAQYPRVDIPGSEVRKITSSIVTGQEYELHILLPGGHKNSTKKFPVVYLMDSQWDFPLVKSLYGQHYFDGFIPEIIIVGVTWGGVNPNPDSLRARDYTPTKEGRLPQSGGADKFLSFMKDELFPFIETNYKADSKNRTLMGCSLGGLITLYALFTHTDMFNGYVAASPAFGWDREVIYQYEKTFFEKKLNNPARLYMTMGDVEKGEPGFEKLATHLNDRNYSSLKIKSKVLENTGHSGTKGEGFSRGLQYIYEKPDLNLDAAVLNKYVGNYEFSNGNKLELKNENGKLALYFSPTNKYILFAASETEFYAKSEFFKVYFNPDSYKAEGFRLDRYGNSQQLKKTN